MLIKIVKLILFLSFFSLTTNYEEKCFGKSEIVLTLDGSASINGAEWLYVVNFTAEIIKRLRVDEDYVRIAVNQEGGGPPKHLPPDTNRCNQYYKPPYEDRCDIMCLRGFTPQPYQCDGIGSGRIHFNLSGNQDHLLDVEVDGVLNGKIPEPGCTPLHLGLRISKWQLENARVGVQRYVIILTDGRDHCDAQGTMYARELELDYKALIYSVGVGNNVDVPRLQNTLASHPNLYSFASDFQDLLPIVDVIQRMTCLDVYELDPSTFCSGMFNYFLFYIILGDRMDITVRGTGFIDLSPNFSPVCRMNGVDHPAILINENFIWCSINWDDSFQIDTFYEVEVSVTSKSGVGLSYSSGKKTIMFFNCSEPEEQLSCLDPNLETCRGQSDIIFILDTSHSVDNDEWRILTEFTYNVSKELCINDEYAHIGVIEFTTECGSDSQYAEVILDLGFDRTEYLRTIRNLGRCGAGGTPLHKGLELAVKQFQQYGRGDAQKYVIVVSDGITDSCIGINNVTLPQGDICGACLGSSLPSSKKYWDCTPECCYDDNLLAEEIESLGALIFGIAVGSGVDIDQDYVQYNISTWPALYAHSESFDQIQKVTFTLVEKTCLDVYLLKPNSLCGGVDYKVNVTGAGFLDIPMKCSVNGVNFPGTFLNDRQVECDIKWDNSFELEVFYNLEVSINQGITWSEGEKSLLYFDCSSNFTDDEELECAKDDVEVCRGASDIIFVLDTSFSVDNNEWISLRDFSYNVTKKLCIDEKYAHVAIIEFTTFCDGGMASVISPLSGDRDEILKIVRNLGRCGAGGTPMHAGLELALDQILLNGRDEAQTYVIVVSDGITDSCRGINGVSEPEGTNCLGCLQGSHYTDKKYWDCTPDCCYDDNKYVKDIENTGALVFGIVVGEGLEVDKRYIKENISSWEVLFAESESFSQIREVTKTLVEKTCLDVYRLEPNYMCKGWTGVITIKGTGFLNIPMKCKVGDVVYNARYLDDDTLECDVVWDPSFKAEVFYDVEVSINQGIKWSNGEKPIIFYDCQVNQTDDFKCSCYGQSDIVFVLDTSFSVDNKEWKLLNEFAYNVTKELCIDDAYAHVSFIEFTTNCPKTGEMSEMIFKLNGKRKKILKDVRNLGRCGAGGTPLHAGLLAAYEEIRDNGREFVYKYVVVITDGVTDACRGLNVDCDGYNQDCPWETCGQAICPWEDCYENDFYCYQNFNSCCQCDLEYVKKLEDLGVFIFSVAVGSKDSGDQLDTEYMEKSISSHEDFFAHTESWEEISQITKKIVDSTCIDIFYLDPSKACQGDQVVLRILGTGFVNIIGKMYVRFEVTPGEFVEYEVEYESRQEVTVVVDLIDPPYVIGKFKVQVSIGGMFWSRPLFFVVEECNLVSQFPRWIPIASASGLLGLLCCMLCLALCLLLSLCIIGSKRKPKTVKRHDLRLEEINSALPLEEPEPEPEPEAYLPPPRMDRSTYYIGGRAMTVDWGNESGAQFQEQDALRTQGIERRNQLYDEIRERKLAKKKKLRGGMDVVEPKEVEEPPAEKKQAVVILRDRKKKRKRKKRRDRGEERE